ncbi:nucleolar protein 8 [Bicyclus anynana]|uniref:Nucleolar protein 8 n=1 Tax=Bicyclus anynana TaxID=110368 RepID=A0A6J1N2M6_BICAN|nr:nucleolar protein 8 [Bicyclus anynana]
MALNTRLFVGNLPDNFNEHSLREAFSSYGEITNFDLKCKPGIENDNKKRFAFITLSASNFNVESCIKYFTNENFDGNRLYVTRARESFLERLQREREQTQNANAEKNQVHLTIKQKNTDNHHNTHKRKFENDEDPTNEHTKKSKVKGNLRVPEKQTDSHLKPHTITNGQDFGNAFPVKQTAKLLESDKRDGNVLQHDDKKQNSDMKRQESMKKKRQEFNEKKNIIKTGLVSIDKKSNKKIIFSDSEVDNTAQDSSLTNGHAKQNTYKSVLFDDGASDDEINFQVKKQYEGKKGQKVLDLQSRYKSDKRFTLDERFVEDSESDKDAEVEQEEVDLNQADEKSKQLNILQDVLGVAIKSKSSDTTMKTKAKLGMLRFDPTQPDHAKYLVPVTTEEHTKSKKKKSKESKTEENQKEPEHIVEKVEVSKEQFYKISDSLKDHNAMAQSTTFSLRSLFQKEDDNQQEGANEDVNYIPLKTKKDNKVKNPLDPGEKNPFVYDSSESESEDEKNDNTTIVPENNDIKTVWRENLFLSITDHRLKEGLMFFVEANEETQKERRELKSVMKKRIHNNERKNTMFQKKIGGKKKPMRGKFRKN